MGFVCAVCGEFHDDELRDIRLGLPDAIYALPEDERRSRTWLADDFAVLDDRVFYVRGLLELPIPDEGGRFGYGAWVEVDLPVFQELMRRWHEPEQFEAAEGRLANTLDPYEETLGLAVTVQPVAPDKLPALELGAEGHPLVEAQRHGISRDRANELAAVVLHR